MHLKRNILETFMANGIQKFILLGENVLNFHGSDDCYYEEWFRGNRGSKWLDRGGKLQGFCNG